MFTIKTNRLILRPWQESDLEPFAALNADPRVMEFFPDVLSRQESDQSVARYSDHIAKMGWGFWAASLIETGEFIGSLGLNTVAFKAHFTPAVEIGWRLACKHWGKGYATEGAKAALHYGFETLKLPEIVSLTAATNLRSRHVMEKIGMHRNPADDFAHPRLSKGNPLSRCVLYRSTYLTTSRLILRTPQINDADKLKRFEERNTHHLSPWRTTSPGLPQHNCSIRFFLFLKEDPEGEIIGLCNFSQIFRGPFQACYLGYHLDAAHQGKGFMSEAVERATRYMFQEQNIHRIMANHMPSNTRSSKLLQKLGFTIEGKAEKYLLINGQWEDHVLTSLTNPEWRHV